MPYVRILVVLTVVAVFMGCQRDESVDVQPTAAPAAAESAKQILEATAESGDLGSAEMELEEALGQLEDSQELLADLEALKGMSDPAAIKAKAKEMANKLGSGASGSPDSAE